MTDETKLPLMSHDVLEERLGRLRELFPEAFTEGKFDVAKLSQLLGDASADAPERYGLSWAGKSDAIKAIQTLSPGTLLPVRDESVNFDTTENLIIEGDNLEVLKQLQGGYHGRVKMIYIDPPYNTGGDFIYPDNYKEGLADYLKFSGQVSGEGIRLTSNPETDGRYHSKWLTMIYPRLFLARNLLREDDVIFVSIDDHEVHNLRMVMNEIFGEENFIETFIWKKSYGGGAKEQFAVQQHEYCLLYARSAESVDEFWLPPDPDAEKRYYKYRDEHFDERGPYRLKPLEATKSMDDRANLVFPIPAPDGTLVEPKKQWWWSKTRVESTLADNGLVFTKTESGYSISYKQYLIKPNGEKRGIKPFSIIDGIYTQQGTDDMRKLFDDEVVLQFPKPVQLIRKMLQIGSEDDSIILDFFAGSGTTGQAVLETNAQDGGNRKFILVQLPQPTDRQDFPTVSAITKERVRRAIKALDNTDDSKLPMGGATSRGFKVFELSSSNFKVWDAASAPKDAAGLAEQLKLMAHNLEEGRADESLLYELLLRSNLPLTSKIESGKVGEHTFYDVADGTLTICLERKLSSETLRALMARKPKGVICLDIAFAGNDQLKTNTVLEMKSHAIDFHTA
ncbi:MAG: site-specific DNA-methyltransferase [Chthoniobacterales bacterium]